MKKNLILFTLFFIFSCSFWWEKTVDSWNVKKICDSIQKWKKFSDLKSEFWDPTLLAESMEMTSYYYWDHLTEICNIYVKWDEIIEKNYVNIKEI